MSRTSKKARQPAHPEPSTVRRSTRSREAPKDPYVETLAVEAATPKRKRVSNGPTKSRKRLTIEELWEPKNLVTKQSPFISADLSKILNPVLLSRDNMSAEDYDSLIALLPAEDIIYPSTEDLSVPDLNPMINPALFDSISFKEAIRTYQENLEAGKYEPEYIKKGKEARKCRINGDFDAWKDQEFEVRWGDKQRVYYGMVAGESSKVKLQDLAKHHQFKVGDVFSLRRPFLGGPTVRKDATLTEIDDKTGAMTFRYPSGEAEWEKDGVTNKTVSKVISLTALELLLLKEDGKAFAFFKERGIKIPNGNAWKTVRVIRNGEDIGCVFDVRAKFWSQYLKN